MNNKLMGKTFLWMCIGLLVTFATGLIVTNSEVMFENIYSGSWYLILAIVEIVLVIFLSAKVMKMKPTTAKCVFLLYSVVSGLTFSSIFICYNLTSILFIFLVTAVVFAVLALIGYTTKVDLTKLGTYFVIGLFAIIIVSIINIFIGNTIVDLIVSIVCVVLFLGVTMYDVQKIKMLSSSGLPEENLAIYGALDLYLDFINLFIHLLSIFGKSDD